MTTPSEQLEGNIVATVATAEAVLAHFEHSLIEAGFAEGAESYTRLAETLIGQRLWAESSGMATAARFDAVAAHARAIHGLLVPYVEAFHRLAALAVMSFLDEGPSGSGAGVGAGGIGPTGDDPVGVQVLTVLDRAGRPMSATALRAEVGVSRTELSAALDRLSREGLIERHRVSGRELIQKAGCQ